jgi:succinate dehydrogenase/fumarate reductase flavoprotein subunit
MSEPNWDVIVVGAGSAGMPLAICAAERGARVLVIEGNDHLGGQLHWSSGQLSAAGTRLQAAKGIHDTPVLHLADALRVSRNTADAAALKPVIDGSAETLHWLLDAGFSVMPEHPIIYYAHEPYEIARTYFGPKAAVGIFDALLPLYEGQEAAGRLTTRLSTLVTELVKDSSGAVVGVRWRCGSEHGEARAKNVVLATGGFARNPEKFLEYTGYPLYSWCSEHSQGRGHDLGLAAGGVLKHGDKYLCTFAGIHNPKRPDQYMVLTNLTPQLRQPWELYVNLEGRRFMREDDPSVDAREHALLKQPKMSFWAIYDQGIVDAAAKPFFFGLTQDELRPLWNIHASFRSAATLELLADRCNIDVGDLRASVEQLNAAVAAGRDPAFGREHLPLKLGSKGPYFAVLHHGISVVGWAGLDTDPNCQVLDGAGRAIRNLYAVGEVRGFGLMNGNAFIGGMGLQPALTMGRLLGQKLLHW